MAQSDFQVVFDFTSTQANGYSYSRTVTVRAETARQAENLAWARRVSFFGARGNDNAIDCRVKPPSC